MIFGEKVKYARSILNISQEKMAKLLDVSFSTVNRWEMGHSLPTYNAQQKFEDLCQKNGIDFGKVEGNK